MRIYLLTISLSFIILIAGCKNERANVYPQPKDERKTEIFLTPAINSTSNLLLQIDANGDTLQIRNTGEQVGDYRKWVINGRTYYSYFLKNPAFYSIPDVPYGAGYRVITDTEFNILKKLTLVSHNGINATAQPALENHDFLMLGENHFITLAYYEKSVSNIPAKLNPAPGIRVATPVIQETKNGQVIWQWVGSDYPELYETSVEGNGYNNTSLTCDYLHVNSMWIDPKDKNLIISCRNSNQIIKLNRQGNGIIWQLGGINSDYALPAGMQFLRQHYATYINDGRTLLLLDNGEINERNYSRVVEFDLDEDDRKIIAAKAFNIPEKFARFGGSVQKFGERYFIGCGSSPYIMEINSRTGVKTFEKKLELGSYRALKYE